MFPEVWSFGCKLCSVGLDLVSLFRLQGLVVTGGRARCAHASRRLTHCPVERTVHRGEGEGDGLGVRPASVVRNLQRETTWSRSPWSPSSS